MLRASRPAAIFRRIVSTVVDPIDRMLLAWPRSNISDKANEVLSPFGADSYALCSILAVVCVLLVVTPLQHGAVNPVKRVSSVECAIRQSWPLPTVQSSVELSVLRS